MRAVRTQTTGIGTLNKYLKAQKAVLTVASPAIPCVVSFS